MAQKAWKWLDLSFLLGKRVQKLPPPPRSREAIDEDIERLKLWLIMEEHLPKDIDPEWLEAFVVGTKSLEMAKQKLEAFFTLRTKVPQLFHFSKRDPLENDFKNACKAMKVYFLPKPTAEGYRVFVITVGENFMRNFVHAQLTVRLSMVMEVAMSLWPDMPGLVSVTDMKGIPKGVLTKVSPSATAYYLQWFQTALPIKLKKGLLYNSPAFMSIIVNTLLKPFMKAKMFNRLIITSDGEKALKRIIHEDLLPSDFGGKEPSSDELNEQWIKILEDRREWFMKTSTMILEDEKSNPEAEGTFGAQGTFRKLDLD